MKEQKGLIVSAIVGVVFTLFLTVMWEGSQGKDFIRRDEFKIMQSQFETMQAGIRDIRNFLMGKSKDGK